MNPIHYRTSLHFRETRCRTLYTGIGVCPGAGAPISATGHNKTEYGGHVTDVCFNCHGHFPSANPAWVVPVVDGDLALTAKGLAPIGNQFLNSPHAKYTGTTSRKIDIGNKNLLDSSFIGYICRTSQTQNYCTGPGTPSECCTGVGTGCGSGSILTTAYRNGVPQTIHTVDTTTNPMCTNPGSGSPSSGAGGFWVPEGDIVANVSPGAPGDTAQGNCMTCHDMHWGLADSSEKAEPLRRECTTCHMHPAGEASASGAPQIDIAKIKHLKTAGTPFENMAHDPNESCIVCHMPKSSGVGSPMHLWRISTDPNYETMGFNQVNTAPDGSYDNAGWVDLDLACGQCHGGSGPALPGVPYYNKVQLAGVAKDMHRSAGVNYPVTFMMRVNAASSLTVDVTALVECPGGCPTFSYQWDWGDGTPAGSGASTSHAYADGGSHTVTLTVLANGKTAGTASRSILLRNPDLPPVAAIDCTWDQNTGTMTVDDSSVDDGPDADTVPGDGNALTMVVIDWGDGSLKSFGWAGQTFTHTYTRAGTFTVSQRAIDRKLQMAVTACPGQATPTFAAQRLERSIRPSSSRLGRVSPISNSAGR